MVIALALSALRNCRTAGTLNRMNIYAHSIEN